MRDDEIGTEGKSEWLREPVERNNYGLKSDGVRFLCIKINRIPTYAALVVIIFSRQSDGARFLGMIMHMIPTCTALVVIIFSKQSDDVRCFVHDFA